MPFIWVGCLDGSCVDMNKIDAFTVGQVQKHDSEGNPMFTEDVSVNGALSNKEPIMQLCVFAVIGSINFPMRLVSHMSEAQLLIQSMLGNLKAEYNKERGVVQVATHEEKSVLKLK